MLLASLTVHEAAHAWAADRLGDPTARLLGRLTLNPVAHIDPIGTLLFPLLAATTGLPLIGWAKPVPVNGRNLRAPRRDFALVAAAGPASNLGLAVLGAVWLQAAPSPLTGGMVGYGVLLLVVVNVLLAIFNMLPIPPLDGGNVLIGVLPAPAAHAVDRLRPYGIFVLYALMFSGVFRSVVLPVQERLLGWLLL
ncbi:MAG: site-2 protease family protein [Vicinamibacterales bacterium]